MLPSRTRWSALISPTWPSRDRFRGGDDSWCCVHSMTMEVRFDMAVRILLNRKSLCVAEGTTIQDLIAEEGYEVLQVVVVTNGELLSVTDLDVEVRPGDQVRILPMVAGG